MKEITQRMIDGYLDTLVFTAYGEDEDGNELDYWGQGLNNNDFTKDGEDFAKKSLEIFFKLVDKEESLEDLYDIDDYSLGNKLVLSQGGYASAFGEDGFNANLDGLADPMNNGRVMPWINNVWEENGTMFVESNSKETKLKEAKEMKRLKKIKEGSRHNAPSEDWVEINMFDLPTLIKPIDWTHFQVKGTNGLGSVNSHNVGEFYDKAPKFAKAIKNWLKNGEPIEGKYFPFEGNWKESTNKMKLKEAFNQSKEDLFQAFIPWGSSDISTAIETANDANVDFEEVYYFFEEMSMKVEDFDIVAGVYEVVLNNARNNIEQETHIDILNDGYEIYTAGNYIATSYDYSGDTAKELEDRLKKDGFSSNDFDDTTQWFFDQLEISL